MAKAGKVEVAGTFIADSVAGEVGVFGAQDAQQVLALNQLLDARVVALEQALAAFGYVTTSGSPPADPIAWGQIGGTLNTQTDLQAALDDASETSIQANGGVAAQFPTINFAGAGVSRSDNTINIDPAAGSTVGNGGRVRLSAAQTITSSGSTFFQVNFNANDFDDGGISSTPTVTVPAGASRIIVTANLTIQQNKRGHITTRMERDGVTFSGGPVFTSFIDNSPVLHSYVLCTGVIEATPGQVFRVTVNNPTGSSASVNAGAWMNLLVLR